MQVLQNTQPEEIRHAHVWIRIRSNKISEPFSTSRSSSTRPGRSLRSNNQRHVESRAGGMLIRSYSADRCCIVRTMKQLLYSVL